MSKVTQKRLRKIDIQIALLTAFLVVLSSICMFTLVYRIAYDDMLASLGERVDAIYGMLDKELSCESFFDINSRDDMDSPTYIRIKERFSSVKQATGVQYLYTAKRGADGQLIYVIDGLDQSASDFRYPGDLIESEIVPDLERALAGERVMPTDIKHTAWGNIFITYLPIHNSVNEVVGAIGIEFFAEHQYRTYQRLRSMLPIASAVLCVVTAGLMLLLFRKLSSSHDRKVLDTDQLTGLSNRSAYDVDRHTLSRSSGRGLGLLVIRLCGLRKVNDSHGHQAGDNYIVAMATAMGEAESGHERLYRISGGEFAVLINNAGESEITRFARTLDITFRANCEQLPFDGAYKIGWTICTGSTDAELESAYREANAAAESSLTEQQ